ERRPPGKDPCGERARLERIAPSSLKTIRSPLFLIENRDRGRTRGARTLELAPGPGHARGPRRSPVRPLERLSRGALGRRLPFGRPDRSSRIVRLPADRRIGLIVGRLLVFLEQGDSIE